MRITQISIEYINNYTQNKREHQRCNAKSNYENKISEGDVLLLHDERNPRTQWNLGFADKINPSRDNKVRGVIVRYMKNGTIFRVYRPMNKLYPTEYKNTKMKRFQNFLMKETSQLIFRISF